MGCCGMFKPLRTSAKDSKTGCCTIVKVLTFYVLGCSACRKARKRVPKAIRRKFSESWRHEVDLGSNFPEDSDEEIEPRPRLANISSSSSISSEYFLDKRNGNASATVSRLPHSLKYSASCEFKDLSEAEMNDARKEVLDSHHPSIASLTLRSSTPEDRGWMFLPPKATKEMRGIRNGRGTRITKESMREKSFRGSIGAARAEAERRERESNGTEKWDIREIGTLNDGFWQGTNKWEPFRIKKKVSFSPVATQTTGTPDRTKGTDSALENQPLKPRDTSPHPPPPPIWPALLTSVVASQSSRNTTNRQSIATSTSSPTRRGSEDTATTGSTDLTIPDSPWLKEAISSPLPVTPVIQSPILAPRDQQNTKLSGYPPELNLNVTKIPVLESSDSQDQNLNSLVVNSTSATFLEIFRNTKYKPHLVWEEWKAQKKESLQVVGEAQMVALADLSDKRPGIHPSFHALHEENSTSREWRPWFAMEKKVKRRQSDPELSSAQEGGGEVVTVEDVFSGKEPGFKFPNLWKWSKSDQKGKGKVKPEEYDGCEIHPLNGTLYDFGEWGFNKPPESNTEGNKTDGYKFSTIFNVEISEIGGGEGSSKEEGTEEYERLRMRIGEWKKEDYEAAMKGWGRDDVEKALMLGRIEKMDSERKKRDSR